MRSRWQSLYASVFEGQLTRAERGYLLVAIVLALVTVSYFDYHNPELKLAPSAVLFVIAIAGVGGLLIGIGGAILTALLFSLAESGGATGSFSAVVWHTLLRATSYVAAVALVELIRKRSSALGRNAVQIRKLELEHAKTQLSAALARFQVVGESLPFGVWYCNLEGHLIYMSRSFLDLVGMTLDQVTKGGWLERVAPEDGERIRQAWRTRDQWPPLWEDEYRLTGVDGKIYCILVRGRAVRDEHGTVIGWAGINLDVTERVKSRERLGFLADAGRLLALSLDPSATLERVAGLVAPRLADWCEVHLLAENGDITTVVALNADPAMAGVARTLRDVVRRIDDPNPVATVIRTGKPELIQDVSAAIDAASLDEAHRRTLAQLGARCALIMPLRARDRTFGALTLAQTASGRQFNADDVAFVEILAARAALAYDNARSYAREHRVASTLQRASLPTTLPQMPGIRVQAAYLPGASESEIGGDWYDAFRLPDGNLALSIGDVAGKGLRAAVAMSSARQALRAAALEQSSPGDVLRRTNALLTHEAMGMVTAVFGILDPVALTFTFATAGHPPPLLVSPEGVVEALTGGGLPLGLFNDHEYGERTATMAPGSLLVLYTDGLVECERNIIGGQAELAAAVAEEAQAQTPDPAQGIVRRVVRGASPDDVAVLTVSVSSEPLDHVDLIVDATPASARVVRQALRRLAVSIGLHESATMDLLVASGEAISNVIEHAYGVDEGELRVRASRQDGELEVEIQDRGRWRDADSTGGGRGLLVMRALMTRVEIERTPVGTTVLLRKSLADDAR